MGCPSSSLLLVVLFASVLGCVCSCEVKNGTQNCVVEGEKTAEILPRKTKTIENDVVDEEVWSKFRGKERMFEQQLEALLRSVLENGLPAFGIPPLDPIAGNISIGEIDLPGVIKLEYLDLEDCLIVGLSNVLIHTLSLQLLNLQIIFNLTFPLEVTANHTELSVILGDLLPFKVDGTLSLVTDLRLQGLLSIGTLENRTIYLDTLEVNIFFDSLEVDIENMIGLTGGKTKHIFNNLMGEIIPELINLVKPYIMHQIIEAIRNAVNSLLIPLGLTFQDLLNCFLGIGNCPFELP
ncbi:uncharacterized protein LOC111866816 [Cryptotermes secundus]|nr:uncharacterized protein LOC111866816 [Cryptotermes secundus]